MLEDNSFGEFFDKLRSAEQGPLLGRLEELRMRLIRSMAVTFSIFVLCFAFAKDILLYLELPLLEALPPGAKVLHFMGPLEVFVAYIQVAFTAALCLSLPILMMQIWRFIKPALSEFDQSMVVPFFVTSIGLFVGGILFCFYVMMPIALKVLIEMGQGVAIPTITVADYVSMTTFMLLGFGASFELPIILIVLARLGVISLRALTENRRYIIVMITIAAAIITPTPDPLSQIALGLPMYMMCEAAILVIKTLRRRDIRKSRQVITT